MIHSKGQKQKKTRKKQKTFPEKDVMTALLDKNFKATVLGASLVAQ